MTRNFHISCNALGILENCRPVQPNDIMYYKEGEKRRHVELRQKYNTAHIDAIINQGKSASIFAYFIDVELIEIIGPQYINGWHIVDCVFKIKII